MQALEKVTEIRAAATLWQKAFRQGADVIGTMSGKDVLWHPRLEIWGAFGKTGGKRGIERDWNAFGQQPRTFRSNMIVEINQPPSGIDTNLQAVFARNAQDQLWLLHQGRMSVAGKRVTEANFIAATGLKPIVVTFSDTRTRAYHPVADLSAPPAVVQDSLAAFIAKCAQARVAKLADGQPIPDLSKAQDWERGLNPESVGTFEIAARSGGIGRRVHGEIWGALVAALKARNTPHSNDRVAQYGPDLFTFGRGPKVLFEIKARCGAHDIFEGVGQLHIYEQLLGGRYRKVMVVPKGMGRILRGALASLNVDAVEFHREGRKVVLDAVALNKTLR
jgi:hypothetical protein